MWIHQTGDLYECSECGAIEHVKPMWRFCPVCGRGDVYRRSNKEEVLRADSNDLGDYLKSVLAYMEKRKKVPTNSEGMV